MKRYHSPLFLLLILPAFAFAQRSLLQSGPMLGYNEMREVMLWVQTREPARVQFSYWVKGKPGEKFSTDEKMTLEREAFTAKLTADEVEPGTEYEYRLLINGQEVDLDYPTEFRTQELWQWRHDPPAFSVAIGSCSYINESVYDRPGTPYGSDYQIFSTIHRMRPDAMIWLGDNVYLREVDWYSRTGIFNRYTHTRSLPEMQPLLASTHHYAIWDDHDYGPNDSDRSYVHKETTLEAFRLFWANPTFGVNGQKGITSFFQYNDIDFFLMDDRYFRSPNRMKEGVKTMLGKEQLEWLIDALVASYAPFKMVCIGNQVLNPVKNSETYENLFPEERAYLLKRIEEEGLKNVIFLTGDRHKSELSKYVNAQDNTIYDLTISPLTAGVNTWEEENELRVEGTEVKKHNFGLLEFSGPRTGRVLTIRVIDADGNEEWSVEIPSEK
ncbi:MAG: alkaline phosphatase family protein [Lewinellaceae bacterium]|nr:alkaline phosphatase family protein [Lewinellaceae bacterium]